MTLKLIFALFVCVSTNGVIVHYVVIFVFMSCVSVVVLYVWFYWSMMPVGHHICILFVVPWELGFCSQYSI
jgi:hypothetical protein